MLSGSSCNTITVDSVIPISRIGFFKPILFYNTAIPDLSSGVVPILSSIIHQVIAAKRRDCHAPGGGTVDDILGASTTTLLTGIQRR